MRWPGDDARIGLEVERGDLTDPHLAPDDARAGAPTPRRSAGGRAVAATFPVVSVVSRAERRIVDLGVREVARHVDAGDRDQLEPRVATAARARRRAPRARPRSARAVRGYLRRGLSAHRRVSTLEPRRVSTSSSSMSAACATKRSTESSTSCRWPTAPDDQRDADRGRAATGPGGRPRPPRRGTGGAGRRRSAGSRRASPSATGSPGRGGRSRPQPRACDSHCSTLAERAQTRAISRSSKVSMTSPGLRSW